MTRQLLLTLVLLAGITFSYGQTRLPGANSSSSSSGEGTPVNFDREVQLKRDIDEVGLSIANKLMRCCSSWGGNNVYASVDYAAVRQNTTLGAFTIPMQVGWYGSLTGTHYWIKGKLVVYADGQKEWLKISDSGGFSPGCSKDCVY